MKFMLFKSSWQELSKNTIFIDFGQVHEKLLQYKINVILPLFDMQKNIVSNIVRYI